VLHGTVATWIGNAAAVLSGTWGAVTRRAHQSGFSRTAVYTHAQRVVQAVASAQAGGISYAALWHENARLKAENGPCTCPLRINTPGASVDHHRSKKT
jgi:hypothetical protein